MPGQFYSPEGDLEEYFITNTWLIDQYIGDRLFVFGFSAFGRLGAGNPANKSTPITTFSGGTNWKQVSGSNAIKTDGTLWTWGDNTNGQLGNNVLGVFTNSTPITTFAGGNDWKQVSSGGSSTYAIKTDGTLWTWGANTNGDLGVNDTIDRSTPVTTFAGGTNWKQVSSSFAIKIDGTLWTWGANNFAQLGINATGTRNTPVTTFAGGNNWKQVSGSGSGVAAIKTDGTLWAWGENGGGQLATNDQTVRSTPVTTFAGGTNWKQVSFSSTVLATKSDGTLWIWGSGSFGALGTNSGNTKYTPVTTFAGGNDWKNVDAGGFTCGAIKTDGTLWMWGSNTSGQLGTNDLTDRSTPVTTFAGGNNWRQMTTGVFTGAVTSGVQINTPFS